MTYDSDQRLGAHRTYHPPADDAPGQREVVRGLVVMGAFAALWSTICIVAGAWLFGPAVCG
jgi:hypothetical protein